MTRRIVGVARLGAFGLSALLALMAAGCGGRESKKTEIAPPPPADPNSGVINPSAVESRGTVHVYPATQFLDGIGISAHAQGETVWITVQNDRDDQIVVHPFDFAVIVNRNLHKVTDGVGDYHLFQPTVLPSKATYAGIIRFPGLGDLVGHRLVYNNKALKVRSYADIEPATEEGKSE